MIQRRFGLAKRLLRRDAAENGHERAFQSATILLFLGGFLTLFISSGVGWLAALLAIPAILLGWRLEPRSVSTGLQVGFFALLLVVTLADWLLLSSFIDTTVHVLIATGLFKLHTRRNDVDYLMLFLISFCFLLVASSHTISAVFLLFLMGYVFLAILTLILFESRSIYHMDRLAPFSLRAVLSMAAGVTLLIALIAAPIFVLVPRTSMGFFHADNSRSHRLSGFSDRVELGDIGRILNNSSPVMRILADRPIERIPFDLKWRGIALNHFDGRSWSNTFQQRGDLFWSERHLGYLVPQQRHPDEELMRHQVTLEVESPVVFGSGRMVMIQSRSPQRLYYYDFNLNLYRRAGAPASYVLFSDISSRGQRLSALEEDVLPSAELRQFFLQLPKIDQEVRSLALEITSKEESRIGKALAIEKYLQESFGYSLENLSAGAPDPLHHFLFANKTGHCEYFATAQAVFMRILGIPARVINGFRQGEYNPWTGQFLVRQSDAHSWVEAYFPGAGWVEFDPTPSIPAPEPAYAIQVANRLLDMLDILWSQVVTFDQMKQIGLFRSIVLQVHNAWQQVGQAASGLAGGEWRSLWQGSQWRGARGMLGLSILGALVAVWILYRYRRYLRAFWMNRVLRRRSLVAPEYYLEMLDILGRRGLKRLGSETPAEFARRVDGRVGTLWASRLTRLYYRNRYGLIPLAADDLNLIYESLRMLRGWRPT